MTHRSFRLTRKGAGHLLIVVLVMAIAVHGVFSGRTPSTAEDAPQASRGQDSGKSSLASRSGQSITPGARGEAPLTLDEDEGEALSTQDAVLTPQTASTGSAATSATASVSTTPSGTRTATPTPTPAANACTREDGIDAYCVYTVREGDTLGHIAERFGLTKGELPGWQLIASSNQPDITDEDDFIQPGQKLRIPTQLGVVHTILLNETVGELADTFDVTSEAIKRANGLTDGGDLISTGQVLLIPDPKQTSKPEPTPTPGLELPTPPPSLPGSGLPAPAVPAAPSGPTSASGFIWPIGAQIRITQYMTANHPLGIDMGLSHAPGTPVRAVAPGTVEFAGGTTCCSYGLYVIVDHGNGLKTLYAHLSSLSVSKGQQVGQGQTLGPSGSTGYSTGVHLHFEVYKNGVRVNPIAYLP